MRLLDRHILRSILALTGIVALGLVAIYTVATFFVEFSESGGAGLGLLRRLEYTLLLVPSSLNILMPLIALIGALMGLGTLARHGELTAMRAAGVSVPRMAVPVLWVGVLLGSASFIFGDWLGPAGEQKARSIGAPNLAATHSIWLRDAGSVIEIGQLEAEDRIGQIDIFALNTAGQLQQELAATAGVYADGHWLLSDVHRTQYGSSGVTVSNEPSATWSGNVTPSVLRLFILQENSISVHGLWRLIDYMNSNHLDARKYTTLLWRKLVEPFSVIAMALFALPFVSGRPRDINAGQRLLVGVLVGIVYYVVNKVSVSVGDLYGLAFAALGVLSNALVVHGDRHRLAANALRSRQQDHLAAGNHVMPAAPTGIDQGPDDSQSTHRRRVTDGSRGPAQTAAVLAAHLDMPGTRAGGLAAARPAPAKE